MSLETVNQLQAWISGNREAGHRSGLVLSGPRAWALTLAQQLLAWAGCDRHWWIGRDLPVTQQRLPGAARQLLGQQAEAMVVVAHDGLQADDLGAAAGIVVGGGLFLLLLPESQGACDDGFQQRLRQVTRRHSLRWLDPQQLPALPVAPPSLPPVPPPVVTPGEQQQQVVASLVQVVTGHRRRPLVLQADRGRGKSAALGLATAALLQQGKSQVIITAPRPDAVTSAFELAQQQLPGSERRGNTLWWGEGQFSYWAPDALLQAKPEADGVWVDEAAAIAAPLLAQLLTAYPRIAFATTVHGYEGTGQGFNVRFRKILDQQTPQWREARLTQPIRWAEGDPLEAWLYELLLLDAEPAADIAAVTADALSEQWLAAEELLQQPVLLFQLMGLLTLAHYQTSPHDLQLLLSDPAFHCLLLCQQQTVLGAVLLVNEGGLDGALAEAIWRGKRRPKGHLLPQLLASQLGLRDGLERRGWRVVRIAVHPQLQRRGLGSRLLQAVLHRAREQALDFVGSSFAATAEVVSFWRQSGFTPLYLGSKRDSASGAYSLLVMTGLSPAAQGLVTQARDGFIQRLPMVLTELWPELDPEVLRCLVGDAAADGGVLSAWDVLLCRRFASGAQSYESALPALKTLCYRALLRGELASLPQLQQTVLLTKLLMQQSWQQVAEGQGLAGRKAVLQQLRSAVAALLPVED